MQYYHVVVTTSSYHGNEPLTYSSDSALSLGQIVEAPVRAQSSLGIVMAEVSKPKFATKSVQRILPFCLPKEALQLLSWVHDYYPSTISSVASQFVPSSLTVKKLAPTTATPAKPFTRQALPTPTAEQAQVLQTIADSTDRSFILHGETGSGKTRIYQQLAQQALDAGQQVLVLTPEIGLTSQLAESFRISMGYPVIVMHSNLTPKERRDVWLTILTTSTPLVVVGPRSALFTPLSNLGLVVVDEFHDQAYKQEQSPYYSALRVAGALAAIHACRLVYGSATPPVTEYYYAQQKHIPILRMEKLALGDGRDTDIQVVDARDRSHYAKSGHLSDELLSAITATLKSKEQALVFLNRRGTAKLVLCQNCGWQALCPKCDLPLTYHGDRHRMQCHTCGWQQPAVTSCPVCHSVEIVLKSIGTKAIADQLQRLFPDAVVKRFDTDNTKDESLSKHYADVHAGKVDIIVGTQMIVKGLDLPRLSMVGIVAADSSLYFPDYTADEQTYQLLTQVIGRVIRGHQHAKVVIQTYQPDGDTLRAAIHKDWDSFYTSELRERQTFLFPPYCFILKLSCSRKTQSSAMKATQKLKEQIQSMSLSVEVVGPTPKFNESAGGNFTWQLIVKSKQRTNLQTIVRTLPANWHYDLDPSNLL